MGEYPEYWQLWISRAYLGCFDLQYQSEEFGVGMGWTIEKEFTIYNERGEKYFGKRKNS